MDAIADIIATPPCHHADDRTAGGSASRGDASRTLAENLGHTYLWSGGIRNDARSVGATHDGVAAAAGGSERN